MWLYTPEIYPAPPTQYACPPPHTDVIDIVNNELGDKDYKREEDPAHYTSSKTGRGHLKSDWISNPPGGVIMCAYKLIKVAMSTYMDQCRIVAT